MVASLAWPAAGTPQALRRLCQLRRGPSDPPPADPCDLRGRRCPAACCIAAAWPWWPRPRTPTTRFGWKRGSRAGAVSAARRPGTDRPRHRRL